MKRKPKLLCSDLDGTMFPLKGKPNASALRRLERLLEKNPNVKLCYVTGRHLKLALQAVGKHGLPQPDYMITDVGTSVYLKEKRGWKPNPSWRRFLKAKWRNTDGFKISRLCSGIPGLHAQPFKKQAEFKASFYLNPSFKARALAELKERLSKLRISYTLVLSKGIQKSLLVDILPSEASKKNAIKTLGRGIGVDYGNIVFAGDSGNDYSVLVSSLKAVLVSNADESFKRLVRRKAGRKSNEPTVYFASGKFNCSFGENAFGVLEGAVHYGIFSSKKRGLRIQMHSIHGLVDSKYTDLGRDEDTGGQVVYVIELAKALSRQPGIEGVDVYTRLIEDDRYPNYSKKVEYFAEKARIVRIPFGGRKYLKKTKFWPYISEYARNALEFMEVDGAEPDFIHANYADAGLAGTLIAKATGTPMAFTAHSLGIPKMKKMGVNKRNLKAFDRKYNFSKRVKAERIAMENADAVIASTFEEVEKQYKGYEVGKTKFHVIPPGIDLHKFHPLRKSEVIPKVVLQTVCKGLENPRKPMVLAISRLDKRKNLTGLVKAFCTSRRLKLEANLVILTGLKNNPDEEQKEIYSEMKAIIRKTGSQESVSLVKFVDFKDGLGPLYRLAAKSKGVFINPAFIEPFGLTVLEASACGLPVIATKNGGPAEVITHGENGMLVNPTSQSALQESMMELLENQAKWRKISRNAVENVRSYSWDATARKEAELFRKIISEKTHRAVSRAVRKMFA